MADDDPKLEDALPGLFAAADEIALAEQARYFELTRGGLLAALIAAIGSAVTYDFAIGKQPIDLGGVISGLAFLVGVLLGAYLLYRKPERIWYENRAVAESIKTMAWQYSVRGGSFAGPMTAAQEQFRTRVQAIVRDLKYADLTLVGDNSEVTSGMTALRSEPLVDRHRIYLNQRIQDQNGYYARRAGEHRRSAQRWFLAAILLQFAGVILAVLKAFNLVDADLLGIAATAAAGAVAWVQTRDSQNLADSYRVTANELGEIIGEAGRHRMAELSEDQWGRFVRNSELAISREHTLWLARREPSLSRKDDEGPAPIPGQPSKQSLWRRIRDSNS